MIAMNSADFDKILYNDKELIELVLGIIKFERVPDDPENYYLKLFEGEEGELVERWYNLYTANISLGIDIGTHFCIVTDDVAFDRPIRAYIKKKYGKDTYEHRDISRVLPPQIVRHAGLEWFYSISANDYFRYYKLRTGSRYIDDVEDRGVRAHYMVLRDKYFSELHGDDKDIQFGE
jgi:hypothetical protein